ncbi:MAG: fused MFS/spermidine synthase [Polyangiaceae bacterium]|nr:fused MFS/spermidine synthase [Polyangiaceae bacterium]
MKSVTPRVALFLFGSGLAALVYQTAWERMLRLVFGASTAASSAVLAIFLGGLGLGGVWLGKRAEASAKPLLLYANLEVGVALFAAVTPFLVHFAARIYWGLGGVDALGAGGATVVRLLLSAVVLGPAVVLMGGTLPAAARAVERDDDVARGRVAMLYASNTAGAVIGALLGTFVLFELFGLRLALWVAVLLNLLVAMLARYYGGQLAPIPTQLAPQAGDGSASPGVSPLVSRFVYAAAAVVGFAFLGLEIVWYRMLGPILGGSSFTFGLILAVALAGIGLGSFIYTRRSESAAATPSLLAFTVALEAVLALVPLALGDTVGLFAAYTRQMASLGFSVLVATWVAITTLVVLPASIVAGFQFPVLFALLGTGRARVARQVGLAYAFNTAGSIAGALVVGFVLMPRLGAVGVWKLTAAILVMLALLLVVLDVRTGGRRAIARVSPAFAAAALALWTLGAEGPTAVTRHTPIGAGRVNIAGLDKNQLRDWKHRTRLRLLWERDGVESSLGVADTNGLIFLVSGKADGAVYGDRGTQALLGVLPALLHDGVKSAFVVGLGTGMTAGWLASIPGVERVDVAELEPAIIEVTRAASAANQSVLERPNVNVFIGDGREFLMTTERSYDLLVSEPSNPYRAGVASLFTREFYAAAAERLKPNGVFAQWVQGYEIDVQTFRIVLVTMRTVFPSVEAWQTQGGDLMLLASREPRVVDVARLRQRALAEPYRTVLPRAGLVGDAEGVISRFLAGDALIRAIGASVPTPVNTDDDNVLEYAFARQVGTGDGSVTDQLAALTQARGLARPVVTGDVDWKRVDELRRRAWLVTGSGGAPDLPLPDPGTRARALAFEAGCAGDLVRAGKLWFSQADATAHDVVEKYVLGQILAQRKDERASVLARELGQAGFVAEERVIRGRYLASLGKRADALDQLLLAVSELRNSALPLCDTYRQAVELLPVVVGSDREAAARAARALLEGPLAVHNYEERRKDVAQQLAFKSGDTALCVIALGRNLELPWWNLPFLAARAECLEKAGHSHAGRARAEVAEWIGNTMGDVGAGLDLPQSALQDHASEQNGDAGVLAPEFQDAAVPGAPDSANAAAAAADAASDGADGG